MPLINWDINLILTWSRNCIISEGNRVIIFTITATKRYIPVVTLSAQNNKKLLQLKPGFKRTIYWHKYQSKVSVKTQNQYLY